MTKKLNIALIICMAFCACKNHYFIKGLRDTYMRGRSTPTISGYHQFHNGVVAKGIPQPWNISKNYNKVPIPDSMSNFMQKTETAAFLIIKNDSIVHESYYNGYSDTSHTNSWSMAKSIVSLLVGAAIKEGKIKSVDEKVSDFVPSYTVGYDTLLTIKDLLTMSSGLGFGENYADVFGYPAKALYGSNIMWLTLKYHCIEKPGTHFFYQSGNTELLGYIITKANGKTLSEFASEELWKPIGAERPAFWSLDHKNGIEKAFCCFNTNARDFARIGKLILNKGKWNGKEIVPEKYIEDATRGEVSSDYGYQWWLTRVEGHKVISAEGFSGQYIIVIPDKNMIVVRLGQKFTNNDVEGYTKTALGICGE